MKPLYIIYICVIAATTLVACSGNPEPEMPVVPTPEPAPTPADNDPILFSQTEMLPEESQSRAALEYDTFSAWGVKTLLYDNATDSYSSHQDVMKRYTVTRTTGSGTTTTNSNGWEYVNGTTQTVKYWDYAASSYRFFGISPADDYDYSQRTEHDNTYIDVTFHADVTAASPYFSKLWFSNNNLENAFYGTTVRLQFMRPFATVSFRFINELGEDLHIGTDGYVIRNEDAGDAETHKYEDGKEVFKIIDPEFSSVNPASHIASKGEITVSYPIEGTAKAMEFSSTPDTGGSVHLVKPETPYTVFPATDHGNYKMALKIHEMPFTAAYADPVELVTIVPAEYMEWKPNMSYQYIFKIVGTHMEFIKVVQVAATEWIEKDGNDEFWNW